MSVQAGVPSRYALVAGDQTVDLNDYVGGTLRARWSGTIRCTHCHKPTRKSFAQGHCYRCFTRLAACDRCIMAPEHCHFASGTCREPDWAATHCMTSHSVYLANSSGLKVGITRTTQIPVRWLDQGATQAIELVRVAERHHAGLIEDRLRDLFRDRTSWQALLKGDATPADLQAARARALAHLNENANSLPAWEEAPDTEHRFGYPVQRYPEKVRTLSFDKSPEFEGMLMGIKGQYLILDTGCLNIRKHTGYEVDFELSAPEGDHS
ncbi:MAG: DUF2797 domain-containing protein [Gammaproteobacteria bacterium]|nr:MAG: DUF2797 domain-containing protein [Gammaproteobacteria bacterium]